MMHTIGKKVLAYWSLLRGVNLIIIALTQVLLRYFVIGDFYSHYDTELKLSDSSFIFLVLASIFIAASGYIINDINDIDIDRVNKRKNVIPAEVSLSLAWILYFILNIAGVAFGFVIALRVGSFQLGLIFPVIIGLLYFYSSRYKGMLAWGNLIIAFLSAFVLLVVWLFEYMALRLYPDTYLNVFKIIPKINLYVWGYALFAFLCTLIREWIKDVNDMEGDKRFGCNTLPIAIGVRKTAVFMIIINILIIALLASFQYYLFISGMFYTFIYIMIAVQTLLVYNLFSLFRMKTQQDYDFISRLNKVIMFAGILSMQILYIDN